MQLELAGSFAWDFTLDKTLPLGLRGQDCHGSAHELTQE